ncbi:MAG: hypothetical protein M1840_001427 [Geoglossum simile]|nr:MAG: hypothetical protein M1840_001427 [Geoglossum simile]
MTTFPSPDSSEETPTRLPSPVVQALDIARACFQGYILSDQWIKIHFLVGQYEILQQQLKQEGLWGYVIDKVKYVYSDRADSLRHQIKLIINRYDWTPLTGELIYRIPTAVHDVFTGYVADEIICWLLSLENGPDVHPRVRALSSDIACSTSSRIFYRIDSDGKEYGERCPDASFTHIKAKYPGVVIEISGSQKRKDLPKLAHDYIIGSVANVSVVIGLDIEYHGTKKATISVWRPKEFRDEDNVLHAQVVNVVNAEPFRNDDGSPVLDRDLTLSLGHFVPVGMISYSSPLPSLTIPYSKLASLLQLGEAKIQASGLGANIGRTGWAPGTIVSKRPESPEETLSPGRERESVESERQEEERTMRDE